MSKLEESAFGLTEEDLKQIRYLQMLKKRKRETKTKKSSQPFSHSLSIEAQLAMQIDGGDISSGSDDEYGHLPKKTSKSKGTLGAPMSSLPPDLLRSATSYHLPPLVTREHEHTPAYKQQPPIYPRSNHSSASNRPPAIKTTDTANSSSKSSSCSSGGGSSGSVGYLPGILDPVMTAADLDPFEDDLVISEIARENSVMDFGRNTKHATKPACGGDTVNTQRSNGRGLHDKYEDEVTESEDFYLYRSRTRFYKQ